MAKGKFPWIQETKKQLDTQLLLSLEALTKNKYEMKLTL